MTRVSPSTCNLCEAECGVLVAHDGARVLGVRGDPADPLSRGHICPKAAALADLHGDPDRLREPMRRTRGGDFEPVAWDEALDEIADRLVAIQGEHGRDAVALYFGNPTVHSHGAALSALLFRDLLGSRHAFSSNSMDALPRLLVSYLLYGAQALLPVPDIDRTALWLIIGANPMVSNGSVMSAPGCRRRIRAIEERGGRVVVVDPRRTETAAAAGEHLFIRPGTDALFLGALVHAIFDQGLEDPGRLEAMLAPDAMARLRQLVAPFAPERVAARTGVEAAAIRALAVDFAGADSAVCYGRMGTCAQEYGTLATWLIDCLNIITGNLDRPGGAMFPTPAVDLARLATRTGQRGSFARYRGAHTGLPEFSGELPVAEMCPAMEGDGMGAGHGGGAGDGTRIRALVTHAGNPALSMPNGPRVERALAGLEFMVAIDIYRNETTRHADFILPTTMVLERDHYPLIFSGLAVRNTVRLTRPVFERPEGLRHDWEIFGELARRIIGRRSRLGRIASAALGPLFGLGPDPILGLGLRLGPYDLSMDTLRANPHGLDLGPLEPRLPELLGGRARRIDLLPAVVTEDLERLRQALDEDVAPHGAGPGRLALIARRLSRSNNSWLHNSPRLNKGKDECVLHMHPDDAAGRAITSGDRVVVRSAKGAFEVSVEVTDAMMAGVVSMPFGWGHDRPGCELSVAARRPGVSLNDITDEARVDPLSGCTSFALPVVVAPCAKDAAERDGVG